MFLDSMIQYIPNQVVELTLQSTFLTASECLVLSANPKLTNLRSLNLSCNPITILGLINLIHPKWSQFRTLRCLELFNCELDYTQAHLIDEQFFNEQNNMCNFCLSKLNLSFNPLSYMLNYIAEFGLIQADLSSLQLVSC